MLQLDCKEMGEVNLDPKVNHVVTGNTVDEVMKKAMEHAKAHHADMLKSMSSPEQMAQLEKMLKSKIKNVA
jgi:predicted small metal-binding protein